MVYKCVQSREVIATDLLGPQISCPLLSNHAKLISMIIWMRST